MKRKPTPETAAMPGPWVAVEYNERCEFPSGVAIAVQTAAEPYARTGTICAMIGQGDGTYDPAVTTANAHLIAAAPAMREALEEVWAWRIGTHEPIEGSLWAKIAAALAQARGEKERQP